VQVTPFFFKQLPGVVESAAAHELPEPQLETEQQTPSVQNPLVAGSIGAHSAELPHALPAPSTFTHEPDLQ
jgi:hypothetical protein